MDYESDAYWENDEYGVHPHGGVERAVTQPPASSEQPATDSDNTERAADDVDSPSPAVVEPTAATPDAPQASEPTADSQVVEEAETVSEGEHEDRRESI
jgi:hypothetical protein